MSRLGSKSIVYHGDLCLGELSTVTVKEQNFQFPNNEIRIHHLSPVSERCSPLSVLQTISSFSVLCKLESRTPMKQPHLINLHASCFYERKTAVVLLRDEEIHLVAMPSKEKKFPCFWCFLAPSRLYDSCLGMLNLRCLAIVFDLDETLIVANTMKSFDDRIDALSGWISGEMDPIRLSGMTAELKRYVEDRTLLKQYTEDDIVADSGIVFRAHPEEVSRMSDSLERVIRPIIRLPDKNMVFTRINPEIRDTSVLVRMRPAWEDLKSYLIAKGRKRFETYVCTMAERDYALEMWRLLDTGAHLISSKQLMDRVICVKTGSKKSLFSVFQERICHPKMAMVIDDRLKVWEDKDQPRVHVVPPFTPYYAPQAETANAVPVLCVARNVACNVRGGFFKEFDENTLRKISELFYEDEVMILPPSPDVSNYMMSEDSCFVANGNNPLVEGLYGAEIDHRSSQLVEKNIVNPSSQQPTTNDPEKRLETSELPMGGVSSRTVLPLSKPGLLGAPGRRDGISTELDSDSKRKSTFMKPPLLRFPLETSATTVQQQGGWLVEEDSRRGQLNTQASGVSQDFDLMKTSRKMVQQHIQGNGFDSSQNQVSHNSLEVENEAGKVNLLPSLSIGVLQEIGRRCGSKVEFIYVISTIKDLPFSVEVLFGGQKIANGIGKTRMDAKEQGAHNALRSLADRYTTSAFHAGVMDRDLDKLSVGNENGFVSEDFPKGSAPEIATIDSK